MRTTVSLDDDVAAAVQALRAERNIGLSDAINQLIRSGLQVPAQREEFHQRTYPMGAKVDVANVAEVLELADGADWR